MAETKDVVRARSRMGRRALRVLISRGSLHTTVIVQSRPVHKTRATTHWPSVLRTIYSQTSYGPAIDARASGPEGAQTPGARTPNV